MTAEITAVLQRVRALAPEGDVETTFSDIGFTVSASDLDQEKLVGIVKAVHDHPDWFQDFELRCDTPSIRLFGRTATGVMANSDGFEELATLGLSTDHDRAEEGYNRYYESNIEEAAQFIHTLVDELHTNDGLSVTLNGIVDKSALESELVSVFPHVLQSEVDLFLWPDPSTLGQYIEQQPLDDVLEPLFKFQKLPVFVFETATSTILDTAVVTTLDEVDELDAEDLADSRDKYQEAMERARKGTVWRGGLTAVPPAAVISIPNLLPGIRPILIYSVFGVFSATVEPTDGLIEFTITSEPTTFSQQVDPHEVSQGYDDSDFSELISAYQIYSEHEDKAAFRDFWRLAIANTCENLVELPRNIEPVKEYYEDLQVDAIEENFDDLSDAIQQIHSFMTGLTNRVSDAATQLSRQIQTLVFTLIGTIIANLFLVLRWSDVTFVPPFSLFILIVLIGFYFPLIQDRIADLTELREEIQKDYKMYESEIRRFSEQIFDFKGLEKRKNSYISMAQKKERWAQTRLDLVFKLLMIVWTGLVAWSFVGYPIWSMQAAIGVASLFGLIAIGYYHSEKEYFDKRYEIACVAIGLGVLALRFVFRESIVGGF